MKKEMINIFFKKNYCISERILTHLQGEDRVGVGGRHAKLLGWGDNHFFKSITHVSLSFILSG